MLNFCTLFDKNYLPYGLSLWTSLNNIIPDKFRLFILCLDEATYQFFIENNFSGVVAIKLNELEETDPELLFAKSTRSFVEYYFTLSPCLPLYILRNWKDVDWICSLDADIYFFSDPQPIFEKFKKYSILICPHKFAKELLAKGIQKFGFFNVSFQAFKKDETGIACLEEWRNKCIGWCFDYYDEINNRFADQKYLDEWEDLYPQKVMKLTDEVTGLAVWNLNAYTITYTNGQVLSNNKKIIFYHFHGLKQINNHWFANAFHEYDVLPNQAINNHIYLPYIQQIIKWKEKLNIEIEANKRYENNKRPVFKRLIQAGSLFYWKKPDKILGLKISWLQKTFAFIKRFSLF